MGSALPTTPTTTTRMAQVQGNNLLDVLKKKMRQTKEEMEKYKEAQSPSCRRRLTGSKTTCWEPRRRTRRWRRRWRRLSRISRTYELVHEKEKFKAISDELDQTFAEMSGY